MGYKSINNELMWAELRCEVTDTARKAAQKCAKIEEERLSKGWRWIKVGTRTRIFVPCEKNGNPTKVGLKRIESLRKNLDII